MGTPRGNFNSPGSTTTVDKLQTGHFGYMDPFDLAVEEDRVYVNLNVKIRRIAGIKQVIRVEVTEGGELAIEFIGFTAFLWKPRPKEDGAFRVLQITAGGKVHTQWSDKLLYVNLYRMKIGQTYYVERRYLDERPTGLRLYFEVDAHTRREADTLPIRRLARNGYQIETSPGKWEEVEVY